MVFEKFSFKGPVESEVSGLLFKVVNIYFVICFAYSY